MPAAKLRPARHPFRLSLGDGSLELIKWLAAALMVVDHVNKYLLHDSSAAMFALGRVVMPLFAVVLAFNLARPHTLANGVHKRVLKRLAIFGAAATLPYMALGGLLAGWWPINILWTLFVATLIIYCLDKRGAPESNRNHCLAAAGIVFVVGGSIVEFWWPGLLVVILAWLYFRRPSPLIAVAWVLSLASLAVINQNSWALAALPILFTANLFDQIQIRRYSALFYFFYPLHLAVIFAVQRV